jgi:CreA protein
MKQIIVLISLLLAAAPACAEKIGEVSTEFIMTGPNSKIVVEAFDDPQVPGVTCHVSYPTKGGLKGALGLVEERSEASIACRQTGPISVPGNLKEGDEVFSKSRSMLFKKLHVVRFMDRKRNVLVYLAFTDKLVDGSPKHSISSVPVMPWSSGR